VVRIPKTNLISETLALHLGSDALVVQDAAAAIGGREGGGK
jgi:hypothetical protein